MKHRYGSIDGLRVIACIGIVIMHIRANTNYEIDGFLYNTVIPSFTNFVFLFMMVSAFGMCCGYYEKVIHNTISFSEFYSKRFKKILPFFCTFSTFRFIDFTFNKYGNLSLPYVRI